MSINQLIHTARSSLLAYQAAMNAVGQNVANGESEGYSRRRITLNAQNVAPTGIISQGVGRTATGVGVSVGTYERVRDRLLDRSSWDAHSFMGGSEEEHRIAAALESVFAVQTEGSLSNQLQHFWNGWSDLADHPTDAGVRQTVRSRGASLAGTLNRMAADIDTLQSESERVLASHVDDVNQVLEEVAELNVKITRGRVQGRPDLVSEDRRDVLIGELSEFGTFRIHDQPNGSVRITLDGMNLVADDRAEPLELDLIGPAPEITIAGTDVTMRIPDEGGGKLAGALRSLTTTLPDTLAALDSVAQTLTTAVNAAHATGTGLDGSTNVDFFQGATASSITLSAAVAADARSIAASNAGGHDSAVANEILSLRDSLLMNGGSETIEGFVINTVSGVGALVERSGNLYEAHAAHASHIQSMADGVAGVSLEEEMTNLIEYQQAFAASARVLGAAEEMMDSLLAI